MIQCGVWDEQLTRRVVTIDRALDAGAAPPPPPTVAVAASANANAGAARGAGSLNLRKTRVLRELAALAGPEKHPAFDIYPAEDNLFFWRVLVRYRDRGPTLSEGLRQPSELVVLIVFICIGGSCRALLSAVGAAGDGVRGRRVAHVPGDPRGLPPGAAHRALRHAHPPRQRERLRAHLPQHPRALVDVRDQDLHGPLMRVRPAPGA
jgi:hypothetical protein